METWKTSYFVKIHFIHSEITDNQFYSDPIQKDHPSEFQIYNILLMAGATGVTDSVENGYCTVMFELDNIPTKEKIQELRKEILNAVNTKKEMFQEDFEDHKQDFLKDLEIAKNNGEDINKNIEEYKDYVYSCESYRDYDIEDIQELFNAFDTYKPE